MAGIGIELRELASTNTFFGFFRSHLYAGILSAGAWIISISALLGIYFFVDHYVGHVLFTVQFLVLITYLIAVSLILSGIFQHTLNRFIADRIFENKQQLILPNFFESILILTLISTPIGYLSAEFLLHNESIALKLITASSFVILNIIWLFSNALAGQKNYKFIVASFLLCYLIVFLLAICLFRLKLLGLILAFYLGHTILLVAFFFFIMKSYPGNLLISKDILHFMRSNPALVFSGFFFYLAIWVDNFCFWYNSNTSIALLGDLHSSPIYDMPIFISFICILPGMGLFFYEIETNFSRYYHRYYDAIRQGATLDEIDEKQNELIQMGSNCLFNTIKVQAAVALFAILFAPEILRLLGLAPIYIYLLRIAIVATSLLILLIAQINLLYYLNLPQKVLFLTSVFLSTNLVLTCLTFYLGPQYYGYGYAIALLISNVIGFILLNISFKKLSYYSFMSI